MFVDLGYKNEKANILNNLASRVVFIFLKGSL